MILFSSTFGSLLPKMLVLKSCLVKTESVQSNRNFYNKAKNKVCFFGTSKSRMCFVTSVKSASRDLNYRRRGARFDSYWSASSYDCL